MNPIPMCLRGRLVLPLSLALVAPAIADPVISEFMAANTKILADSDGQFSDWIEIHNPDSTTLNLAGWYLTDDAKDLGKWQFPAVSIPPGDYLIVFASDKNRKDPAKELHTNFEIEASGEFLGLVMPDGKTIVSQFGPKFPAQLNDISYGSTQPTAAGEAARTGYFRKPTPGARNGGSETLLLLERVTLSRSSGPFTGTVALTMSGAGEGQRIRFVQAPPATTGANVPEPTAASTAYAGPVNLSTSTIIRAAVFSSDDRQQGLPTTVHLEHLATTGSARVDTFSSQLPLLAIDLHGAGALEKDGTVRPGWVYAWNRPTATTSSLTVPPTVASPLAINVRGSSSAEFPKKGFTLRLLDSEGKDDAHAFFGLPSFDTWVLVGPWTFDPTYLHNVLIYDLSNRLGRWAARTQLIEVFLNANGGDLDYGDYAGIYIFTDALKIDKKRIDLANLGSADLTGSAVTGGYLMKFDVPAPEDFSFRTKFNNPEEATGLIVLEPKAADLAPAQRDYIRGYVLGFEDALQADAAGGWKQRTHLDFLDRDSFVDHHILNTLAMNADAFVRSAYLMKDRRGRLVAGPAWDFDRALGGGDPRTLNPEIWNDTSALNFWTYGWWGMLARDPEFMQAWIDRWQELRRKELSSTNVAALLDGYVTQVGLAAPIRDAERWRSDAAGYGNTPRFPTGWPGEVDNLKSFLRRRSAWIDGKFSAPPTMTNANGTVVLTPAAGTRLAYTTDGSDPRTTGGGVAGTATLASGPVTLPNSLNIHARSYNASFSGSTVPGSPWSSLVTNPGRLVNLSILTDLAAGDTFTMGFVVGGADTTGNKALLARAAGPSLAPLGVSDAHTDPKIELFTGAAKLLENDNWGGSTAISNAFSQVGAFAYVSGGSRDAAVFKTDLAPGNNSVVVSGVGNASGTVIAELYDATPAAAVGGATPRLVNVSVLKNLGAGLTAGFVIGGGSAKKVLIRAVGPTLSSAFGVSGAVSDPKLTLFGANSTKVGDNDDWGGTTALSAAFAAVGAFALPDNSKDAALLATLAPGSYTVQVSGDKASGLALVEVYEVP